MKLGDLFSFKLISNRVLVFGSEVCRSRNSNRLEIQTVRCSVAHTSLYIGCTVVHIHMHLGIRVSHIQQFVYRDLQICDPNIIFHL